MSEFKILRLTLQDFFTFKMLRLVLIPFLIMLCFSFFIFYTFSSYEFSSYHQELIHHSQTFKSEQISYFSSSFTQSSKGFFASILAFILGSSLFLFIFYSFAFVFLAIFSNFFALVILGFLSPIILNTLRLKHYQDLEFQSGSNILDSVFELFKAVFIFLLLLVVFIPLYFIPLVNFFAFNFCFYYLFHRLLISDILVNISNKKQAKHLYFLNKTNLRVKTLLFYFCSFLPFIGVFITLFFMIYLGHTCINQKIELEETAKN